MKFIKILLAIFVPLIALFGLFLLFSTMNDYRPEPVETVFTSVSPGTVALDSELSLVIWNIGYGGLDSSMDFFYDGGKNVRPVKAAVIENLNGILETLGQFGDFDYILLQEVDQRSKRSYRINEYDLIAGAFQKYHSSFGMNYNVWFVPVPLKSPMGKVKSGLQTLSSQTPKKVTRYSFPGNYAWPVSLYMLDRCFLVNYFPVENGKELLVINTHNSAYDDGSLRLGQMEYLRQFLLDEYSRGNYVVVGGDWNQSPSGLEPLFNPERFDQENLTYIEPSYPAASWTWAYDSSVPTNRRVKEPYAPEASPVTVIDQFLISPNIKMMEVKGLALGFQYSDHQPVTLKITLN